MKFPSPLPLSLLLLALTAGCVNSVTEEDRPCPCSAGWTCCESTGMCTQDASTCAPLPARDTEAPSAPVLTASIPGSPTASTSVTLDGTAEPGAIVHLFTTADCSGTLAGSGAAGGSGSFRIQAPLSANASTSFHARALDAARNASPCSAEPLTVLHDDVAPEAPVLERLTPGALSSSSQPLLEGLAEPRSTVRVYTDASCTAALPHTALANEESAFSVRVSVAPNSSTTFHARAYDVAGNASPCSPVGLGFTHDGTPPEAPLLVGPTLLSASSTPRAVGEAEPGTRVRLFAQTGCTGEVLAEGAALADGTFSLPFEMKPNTTVILSAQAGDMAGNASACSEPLAVTHDDLAPVAPSLLETEPVSPSNTSLTPFVSGRAEPGATVLVYLGTPTCEASAARRVFTGTANAQGSFRIHIEAEANTTNRVSVAARDAVGNVSPCSLYPLDYVHDSLPPLPPILLTASEPSPANFYSLTTLLGTAEAGMFIHVYADATCSGPLVAKNRSYSWEGWPVTDFAVQFKNEREGTRVYYATATDLAGNTSACSSTSVEHTTTKGGRQWRITGHPCAANLRSVVENAASTRLAVCPRKSTLSGVTQAEAWFSTPEFGWMEPVTLSDGGEVSDVRGALSENEEAFALWVESPASGAPQVRVRRYVPGGEWQPAQTLSGDSLIASAPALGMDSSGNALALWLEAAAQEPGLRTLRVSRFTSGSGWSAPQSLVAASTALNAHSVRLSVKPGGHAWALWTQDSGSEESLWLSRYTPGQDWSAPERLDLPVLGSQPATYAFGADEQGGAVLAWLERGASPEARHVKVRRYVASEGWSAPHVLSSVELPTDAPQVAVNARGEALVGWVHRGEDVTRQALEVARFTPEAQWSAPVTVQPGPGPFLATESGESTWLTLHDTGVGMAFWFRPLGSQMFQLEPAQMKSVVWSSQFEPASGWKQPQVLFQYGGNSYRSLTTRTNAEGDLLVLWTFKGSYNSVEYGGLELR